MITCLDNYGINTLRAFMKQMKPSLSDAFEWEKKLQNLPSIARPALPVIYCYLPNKEKQLFIPTIGLDTHEIGTYLTIKPLFC